MGARQCKEGKLCEYASSIPILCKVYVFFNAYIGKMSSQFFNDQIFKNLVEESKLNKIY